MPTYEYRCDKCGHEFEREQRISEEPIKKCPSCKAQKAKRLISATSFVLKGGGWYSDLYASPSAKKGEGDAASGDSAPGGAEAKDGGKGEKKADAAKKEPAAPAKGGKDKGGKDKGGSKASARSAA